MPEKIVKCPICASTLGLPAYNYQGRDEPYFECPRCGPYRLTLEASHDVDGLKLKYPENVQYVPHAIRRMTPGDEPAPLFYFDNLEALFANPPRPTPHEQADNLIRWFGDNLEYPGERLRINFPEHGAIVGSVNDESFYFVADSLIEEDLIRGSHDTGGVLAQLSFDGWDRHQELKKGAASGTHAFMAMQFGDKALDDVLDGCFRPAVATTGFELRRLNDPGHQKAGLIDDQLRVAIRAARFLISDLTHENNGAYWEAGYAEGLGKPVIYTCKKSIFANPKTKPHFDANHHLHILWESDDLERVATELKACIRATIPEVKQED